MRVSKSPVGILIATLLAILPFTSAEKVIQSLSLNECADNSKFSASLFNVVFTPANGSLAFDVVGTSTITGNISISFVIEAYGLSVYKATLDPCEEGWEGLCPINEGQINLNSNLNLPASAVAVIPGIAYTVPDLDATVRVYVNSTDTNTLEACVEAELSNGKTVDQKGVAWSVAVISGLALLISAITSGLGHSNTAAHVAANTMALFGYFQSQAFIGMAGVPLPPIVASWTQNFQWSMGIIRLGFLQNIATWYQRSTGGTPSQVLSDLSTESVQVEKRSMEYVQQLAKRSMWMLHDKLTKRATDSDSSAQTVIVRGIERVGFRAKIELTNIFMTGYIFLVIFVIFVVLGVLLFKLILEGLAKAGRLRHDQFQDFRNGWTTVLKGVLFRVVLIAFPQMCVLCFWELTKRDSSGEVVLACFTVFTMIAVLAWASLKVIRLARRSMAMHKNPAYILYSDPVSLNKWGFLYVQFKATAYYFVIATLTYVLIKGMFIALAQDNGNLQAIALVVIEGIYLIVLCIIRPYMDKKTNGFNIAISVINFISAIFLLVFTAIFDQPGIVTGVMGVIFFVYNAVFSLVLLILVMVASGYAIFSKNPDTRYQPMRDDRGSFIKSQSNLGTTELDALGATARGEGKNGWKGARIEDDEESWSASSSEARIGGNNSSMAGRYGEAPRSPVDPSVVSFPSDNSVPRHAPPMYTSEKGAPYSNVDTRSTTSSPAPRFRDNPGQGNPSPWQRGAGYDH
ncbi:hypothetical protein AAFC00_000772 [Neodothiora populina]|uniref:ML-like domain-containing protein n=1 Tax=Neodothiora populina TaxID=2781224 RepID=A0ABR3PLR0_9PEZI